jgi:hypothetical protein
MADGDWFERVITRNRSFEEDEVHEIVRTIFVYGYGPEEAYEFASPPLPRPGASFPLSSFRSMLRARRLNMPVPHLTRFRSYYAEYKDVLGSEVQLIYSLSPRLYAPDGRKYVQWEERAGVEIEQVTHDLDGVAIPGGGTRSVPVVVMTARLVGWYISLIVELDIGSVNDATFRGWGPGEVKFDSITSSLIDGYDTAREFSSVVEYTFRARFDGWDIRRPRMVGGEVVLNDDGVVYDIYRTEKRANFRSFFPSGSVGNRWITGLEGNRW